MGRVDSYRRLLAATTEILIQTQSTYHVFVPQRATDLLLEAQAATPKRLAAIVAEVEAILAKKEFRPR